MLKKAMIMAAGVGSRLEPLSRVVPKPLVPVANVPAMEVLAKHLLSSGITDIIANTYYKAEQIKSYFESHDLGINFKFLKEKELSGTAGGVKKCQFFFDRDDDFIVMSGDGLTDIDVHKTYETHKKSKAIATIVLKEVEDSEIHKYGIVVPNKNGYVESFQEKPLLEEAKSNLANTGIYIFNYEIFNYIPQNTFFDFAKNVFPLLMQNGININTCKMHGYWSDIGSIEQYKKSNMELIEGKVTSFVPEIISTKNGKYTCSGNLNIGTNSEIAGSNIIGKNCKIGSNCKLINSILWDNIVVKDNVTVENSIILPDCEVMKSCFQEIIESYKEKAAV